MFLFPFFNCFVQILYLKYKAKFVNIINQRHLKSNEFQENTQNTYM